MTKPLLIYKASAGSGKTYTLVKEYLKLVLGSKGPDHFKHILAITFTNKAANEMKERVFKELAIIAIDEDHSGISKSISEELGLNRELLVQRAEEAYKKMVYNYSDIAISTIDSFVVKLVKSFAKELELPSQFDVQIDQEEVLDNAIDRLIESSENDSFVRSSLLDMIKFRLEEDKKWDFLKDLKTFAKTIFEDKSQEHLKALSKMGREQLTEAKDELISKKRQNEEEIRDLSRSLICEVRNADLSPSDFFGGKGSFMAKVERLGLNTVKIDPLTEGQLNTALSDNWFKAKDEENQAKAVSHIEKWRGMIMRLSELTGLYFLYKNISDNIFYLTLLNEISLLIEEYKEENGTVLLSDNHLIINKVVANNPVPFIYERIGEKYRHIMIDEFQDTSVTQFHNAIPLIENSLGNDNINLIVGDTKQSIYRFRNGEFEQLAKLPSEIHKKEKLIDGKFIEQTFADRANSITLGSNFRSKNEIIQFNNEFFTFITTYLSGHSDLKGSYDEFEQKFGKDVAGGLVQINRLEKENFKELTLERMLSYIDECLEDGYDFSDIAILVRKRDKGEKVAIALSKKKLPFISQDSLKFDSSKEIYLVMNVIKQMVKPEDLLSGLEILKYLLGDESTSKLHDAATPLVFSSKGPEKKNDRFNISKCLNDFNVSLQLEQECFSVLEIVDLILVAFNIDMNDAFLIQFLDEVQAFDQKYGNDLGKFEDHWQDQLIHRSLSIPDGQNAIKILTIHKSKGLEYPVVIIPFMEQTRGRSEHIWMKNKEGLTNLPSFLVAHNSKLEHTPFAEEFLEEQQHKLIDDLNLTYVAYTRAEDRLYINLEKIKDDRKKWIRTLSRDPKIWATLFVLDRNSENDIWTFGERTKKIDATKSQEQKKADQIMQTRKNWKQKLVAENKKPVENYAHYEKLQEKKVQGVLVHKIFEKGIDLSGVNKELEKMHKLMKIDKETLALLRSKFSDLYLNGEIGSILNISGTVFNEASIVAADGSIYRPDRMIKHLNGLEIIDLKTGDHKEENKEQLDNYAEVLTEIGFTNIRKNLVYFNAEEIVTWN